MGTPKELFDSFWRSVVLTAFPKAELRFKNESRLMRFLGFILKPINNTFMTNYTTTLGTNIYVPSRQWMENNYSTMLRVIPHEFMHMWDYACLRKKYKINMFALLWLSPQVFSVFSLLAILAVVNPWFLCFLVFLLTALPWYSKWRTHFETNGYAVNMLFYSLSSGPRYNAREDADSLSSYFTTSEYYWMCRDKVKVVEMLVSKYETMSQTHEGMKRIYTWLKTQSTL